MEAVFDVDACLLASTWGSVTSRARGGDIYIFSRSTCLLEAFVSTTSGVAGFGLSATASSGAS